jgi:hypothetical protein
MQIYHFYTHNFDINIAIARDAAPGGESPTQLSEKRHHRLLICAGSPVGDDLSDN